MTYSGHSLKEDYSAFTTDFAVFSNRQTTPFAASAIQIEQNQYYAILPKSHRLAQKKELSIEELKDENFVFYHKGADILENSYNICAYKGFIPKTKYLVDQLHLKMMILARELAIGILPSTDLYMLRSHSNLVFIPVIEKIGGTELYLAWRSDIENSEIAVSFLNFVKTYFPKTPPVQAETLPPDRS